MTIGSRPATGEAWELVGLGILPLNENFSVYGKLGGYRGEARGGGIKETRNDLTYGIGGQYDIGRNLGVRLEWQRYTDFGGGGFGAQGDQDILSLNAIYRFR
jgi:OOP family OmpA-OmpF porin